MRKKFKKGKDLNSILRTYRSINANPNFEVCPELNRALNEIGGTKYWPDNENPAADIWRYGKE